MVFISEFLIGFPNIIWLSIVLTSLVMDTWITRCNLKTEFRDGRQRSKPKFYFVFRIQVSSPRFFYSKAIYIHIILNHLIWKGIIWWFYLMIEKYEGRLFYAIMGHVVHYLLCYLCANTYIAKVPGRILSLQ